MRAFRLMIELYHTRRPCPVARSRPSVGTSPVPWCAALLCGLSFALRRVPPSVTSEGRQRLALGNSPQVRRVSDSGQTCRPWCALPVRPSGFRQPLRAGNVSPWATRPRCAACPDTANVPPAREGAQPFGLCPDRQPFAAVRPVPLPISPDVPPLLSVGFPPVGRHVARPVRCAPPDVPLVPCAAFPPVGRHVARPVVRRAPVCRAARPAACLAGRLMARTSAPIFGRATRPRVRLPANVRQPVKVGNLAARLGCAPRPISRRSPCHLRRSATSQPFAAPCTSPDVPPLPRAAFRPVGRHVARPARAPRSCPACRSPRAPSGFRATSRPGQLAADHGERPRRRTSGNL